MKLNIYEKKEIIKTYEAQSYDLMFGTVEDVANALDIDNLRTGSDVEILQMIAKLVMSSMDKVKYLLMDIFEGLTEEEIKKTKVKEIANVLLDVVKFTIEQLNLGTSSKN